MNPTKLLMMISLISSFTFAQNTFHFKDLKVTWEVLENNYQNEAKFLSSLTFLNTSKYELPSNGWSIYFNYGRKTIENNGQLTIEHINGDLFRLVPTKDFKGLKPNETYTLKFVSELWAINNSDAPAGLYGVWDAQPREYQNISPVRVAPFNRENQLKRTSNDQLVAITPELIFQQNSFTSSLPTDSLSLVIPRPLYEKRVAGNTLITGKTTIYYEKGLENEANHVSLYLKEALGVSLPRSILQEQRPSGIILRKDNAVGNTNEAYTLSVNGSIEIVGAGQAGVFYGLQSLRALLPINPPSSNTKQIILPNIEIKDEPKFEYRGVHLDVGRNFQTKATVLKFLDLMSFYKLNKLHFHVTEDEGWRVGIPSLPELTQIGSKRGHTLDETDHLVPSFGSGPNAQQSNGSGFYTRAEFIDILKYATARHIEVIPEVDIPGHSRAAIVAMKARYQKLIKTNPEEANRYMIFDPNDKSEYMSVQMWKDNVMCMCHDAPFNFFETVVSDLKAMYQEAGAPFTTVHTGGDEVPHGVWEKSPICQRFFKESKEVKNIDGIHEYYLERVYRILQKHGLKAAGWEEIALRKTKLNGNITYIPSGKFANYDFVPYVWNNVWGWGQEDFAYKLANLGYKTILSNATNLYFDLAYNRSPEEPGYYWAGFCDIDKPFAFHPYNYFKSAFEDRMGNPIDKSIFTHKEYLTDFGKSNIWGIQGQFWSENIKGPELLEYFALPKLIGLAERAWSPTPKWTEITDEKSFLAAYQNDYNKFLNIVGKRELNRLAYLNGGYNVRLPLPGIKLTENGIQLNTQFPGLEIRYTTDGSEPTTKSPLYQSPIKNATRIKAKTFDSKGRSSRTSSWEK